MKTEQHFEDFIAIYNNGKVVKFEPTSWADISGCVRGIIRFLRKNKIDGEFVLRFNGKKLRMSRLSNPNELVNEYWGRKEFGL